MDKDSKFTFSGTWSNNGEFEIDLTGMDTTKKVYALIDNTGTTDVTYNVTLINMASGYTSGKTLNGGFAVYDSTITVDSMLLTADAHETGEAITVTVGETEKTYYYGINAIQASTITALPSGATEYVFEDGAVFNSASGIPVSTANTVFVGLGENGGSITATSGTALTIAAKINVTMKGVLTIPTVLAGDSTVITLAEGATLKGTAITTGKNAGVRLSNGVTLNDTTITVGSGKATTIMINGAVTMEGTSSLDVASGNASAVILWNLMDGSATKTDYSLNAAYFTASTGSTDTRLYITLKGAAGAKQELGNYTLLTNVTTDPKNNTYFKINGVAKTIGDSVELRTLESGNKVKATLVWEDNAVKLSVAEWVARLVVNAGETKDVSNMTFSGLGGVLVGGALHNSGTVTGTGTSFLNNTGSDGGAVYNQGTMTLTDVTFSGNQANTNGTVNNKKNATMTLKNATFTNNNANQIGGAIYNGGTMTIEDSTFTSNTATYGSTSHGGAIVSGTGSETAGTLTIKNTTFTNNSAKMAGGALAVFNKVDLTDVTFSGNSSKLGGAVVMNSTGKLTLDNVTFNGNTVSGSGAAGGAIYTMKGTGSATITLNGDVYLTNDTDTIVFSGTDELVWNITTDKYGFIDHYSQITFSSNTKRVITVGSDVSAGSYTLAGDASSAASQTFTVRSGESSGSVTVGGDSVTVGDYLYKLEVDSSDQLMLSVKATISEKMVTVSGSYMYNGTAQEANVTVKRGETTLVEGQDYTILFNDNTDAGTASFTITGVGSYEGTYNGTYEIAKRDITLKSGSDTKSYGNTAQNNVIEVSGDGYVDGEVFTYENFASQSVSGSTANTFSYKDSTAKKDNYNVTQEYGILTVTKDPSATAVRSDFNNSGKSDVAQLSVRSKLYVTYDDGGSYCKSDDLWGVGDWKVVELEGDFNGDTYSDVLMTHNNTGNNTTTIAILVNDSMSDGEKFFKHVDVTDANGPRGFSNDEWEYLGAADVNGDGFTDILTVQTASAAGEGDRSINAWITGANGSYAGDLRIGGINSEWKVLGTADIDGDGKDNMIFQHKDGWVSYWSEAGSEMTMIKHVAERTVLATGDFDGDGKDDILWKYNNDDTLWTWTNVDQGESLTDSRIGRIGELSGSWTFDRIGDYDGDGVEEILWSATDGSLAYSKANATDFKNLTTIA